MQNKKDQPSALAKFYAERFRSDPRSLISYFDAEISKAAESVGIRWSSISDRIGLHGEKERPKGKEGVTDKIHRGKVMAWGDTKRVGDIDYPFFTFNNNNPAYGHTTWSGLAALSELYESEGGKAPNANHQRWLEKQAQQKAARDAALLEAEKRRAEDEARIQGERLSYEKVWHCGGREQFEYKGRNDQIRAGFVELVGDEDGSAPYLQAKQVGDIASRFKMKRMRDSHGEFTAVPLHNIDGVFLGLQRLYADKKLQGTGVQMDGAHCVIGDIETAKVRYAVEGFATGASVSLAESEAGNDVAVIVAFNVGNLAKVLQIYHDKYPAWQIRNAADNDQWKPQAGNAGLLTALELARKTNSPAIVPDFAASPDLFNYSAQQMAELRAQNRTPVVGFCSEELEAFKVARKGPTDWNDYHCLFGLKATARALRARASVVRAESKTFDFALQRLSYAGITAEKEAKSAIHAGMLLAPIRYTCKEVLSLVLERIHPQAPVDRAKVRSFANWLAKQKLNKAQQLRSFSPEALAKSNVQHLRIEGPRAPHGGTELPAHLADLVESLEGLVIVRAPMGSGKTEKLIAPIMQAAPKAAYIAHRISLLDDASARLNIQHYQQVDGAWMHQVSHLACCVNSLTHPKFYNEAERSWFTTVDTLCIDEASQVISHTATGPVEGRVRVMDALTDAVASARRVLLCDADANDGIIEFCELACPGKPITILEVTGTTDHIRVNHTDDESAWQIALDWICAGRRVLIANDSAESAKKLAATIEDRVQAGAMKPVRMLLVHADSKADPAVSAFLCNPNTEAVKYDVLIYSPAISSGVSMTTPHFQHHVGLFSGNSVGPSDAIQMLRRDRTAREYLVGIGHSTTQRNTDPESIYRGLMQLDEMTFEFEQDSTEARFVRQKTAFDQIYLTTVTAENSARNDFANNLLLMLVADGYRVERAHLDQQEELIKLSRKNRAIAGELVFEKRLQLIDSVETPDEATFARLNRQEVRSEAESAQVDRFHIENQLGCESITPDDVDFYDNRGIANVVAMELLQSDEEQTKAYDQAQRKARVVLTQHRFKTPARAFLVKVFDMLGIDRYSGQGEFTAAQCREVLAMITESQQALEFYNALKVGRFVATTSAKVCPTTLVKSILDRLGVTVKKRKTNGTNVFAIDPDRWARVMTYIEQRQAKNVHSLVTHEAEAPYLPKLAPEATETPAQPDQPAPALASSDRDTLQCKGVGTEENYPLDVAERIFAFASRCYKPLGISMARIVGELAPNIGLSIARGQQDDQSIKWTLGYIERLLEGARR